MSSSALINLGDRVEHCQDIDDVLVELGLIKDLSRKPWFPYLPKFLQNRVIRDGVAGSIFFYPAMVSVGSLMFLFGLRIVYLFLGVASGMAGGSVEAWTALSILGTFVFIIARGVAAMTHQEKTGFSAKKKRELLVDYCRGLLDDYREKIFGENTNFSKARSQLERWAQKAVGIIDGIEELLSHSEDSELRSDQAEAYEVWEELELSRERLEKRKEVILAFLQRLESRILSIDTTLGKGILRQELSVLKEGSSTAVELAEQAVVGLVISFGNEARTLTSVAQHLQTYSDATLAAERIANGSGTALSGAVTLLNRERDVTAELDQLLDSYLGAVENQAHPSLG